MTLPNVSLQIVRSLQRLGAVALFFLIAASSLAAAQDTISVQTSIQSTNDTRTTTSLTVTRTNPSSSAVTVNYTTQDVVNGAQAGRDYIASAPGLQLSWAADTGGTQTVVISLLHPQVYGGTERKVALVISNPTNGATIGNPIGYSNIETAGLNVGIPSTLYPTPVIPLNPATGVPYSAQFIFGGKGPYSATITSGALPAGLSVGTNGILSGTTTAVAGSYPVGISVVDAAGTTYANTVTIPVQSQTSALQGIQQQLQALASLPAGTNTIQYQVLNWGYNLCNTFAGVGDTADEYPLIGDLQVALNVPYIVPTTLPASLYPTLPDIATNPFATGSIAGIGNNADGYGSYEQYIVTPPVFPDNFEGSALTGGYRLIQAEEMMHALLYQGLPSYTSQHNGVINFYLNPTVIPWILTTMEDGALSVSSASAQPFGAGYGGLQDNFGNGYDTPYLALLITQGWPGLVFPSRVAAWKAAISSNQQAMTVQVAPIAQNGSQPYVAGSTGWHLAHGTTDINSIWTNSDVRFIAAIAESTVLLGPGDPNAANAAAAIGSVAGMNDKTTTVGGLGEMYDVLFPDGGTNYVNNQNEACVYHTFYIDALLRYSRITGDPTGNTLGALTKNYFPLTSGYVPKGGCEYNTAPANKQYWDLGPFAGTELEVVSLTGDPYGSWLLNQWIGNGTALKGFEYAAYWNPGIPQTAIPTSYIAYDLNSQGPRGAFGTFNFQSSTRHAGYPNPYTTGLGQEGLPTFVGATYFNPNTLYNSTWYMQAALNRVGHAISYSAPANQTISPVPTCSPLSIPENEEWKVSDQTYADLAVNAVNASSATSTFGAVSTRHQLAGYEGVGPTNWYQTETWVELPTRIIGLVSLQLLNASDANFGVQGTIKLLSGRYNHGWLATKYPDPCNDPAPNLVAYQTVSTLGPHTFTYGGLEVQIFAEDYTTTGGSIVITPTRTYSSDDTQANWAADIDLNDANFVTTAGSTTKHTYPQNFSHFFFTEIRPMTNAAAGSPTMLSGLPAGVVGFSFTDSGQTYTIINNTSTANYTYTQPSGSTLTMSGAQYRPAWLVSPQTPSIPSPTWNGFIPPGSHIVVVQ